ANVFAPDSRILEINSKSGLYPLYVAYSIYRARVKNSLFSVQSIEDEQRIWDKVVAENIFVICKTPMAKSITKRTLIGFRKAKVNTRYFEELINQIKNKPEHFIKQVDKFITERTGIKNMKFNAIVGNPPYQVMDGGAGVSAKPVYNLFVDIARQLRPSYTSMIMPAKWFTDGKGLDKFRASMFADKRISKIFDFIDSRDCFSNVDIAGGICYFLWDSSNESDCNFTTVKGPERTFSIRNLSSMSEFIRHAEAAEIVEKIKSFSSIFLDTVVSTQKPFGLRTYATPMKTGSLTLKFNKGKGPYEDNAIEIGREMIPQWKNIISCLTAEHAGQTDKEGRKKILSSLDILAPNEICTETYMVIGHFDTALECHNMDKYARTLLFRFLVSQLAATQHLSKEKFALVPIQDFTTESDIDWSQSVADIDYQLYAKYGLTGNEISFIESMIKPM
ncbi:MAG: Eco57I restriction-modification methylase domain-containing protein, partial [Lachnospiraceae bacterium]